MEGAPRPAWEAATAGPGSVAPRRRRLQLKPRSKNLGKAGGYAKSSTRPSSIFGSAKPREEVLKAKGIDHRKIDQKLEERTASVPKMSAAQREEYNSMTELIQLAEAEVAKATDETEKESATAALEAAKGKRAEYVKALKRAPIPVIPAAQNPREQQQVYGGGFTDSGRSGFTRSRGSGRNRCKIFVGSLAWETTDENLRRAFSRCGDIVEANVVKDHATGRSRGFGFITFADEESARTAVKTMDGNIVEARQVKVNFADQGRRRDGGHIIRGSGYGGGSFGAVDHGFQPATSGGRMMNHDFEDERVYGAHANLDRMLEGDM